MEKAMCVECGCFMLWRDYLLNEGVCEFCMQKREAEQKEHDRAAHEHAAINQHAGKIGKPK
jgi:hypothetical protein